MIDFISSKKKVKVLKITEENIILWIVI
jgi:hypothetical protein